MAFLRERRRLLHAILILGGLGTTVVSLLMIFSGHGWFGRWPEMVALGLFGIVLLGYPVLAIFLLANGFTMWRREARSLGNLLSLLLGVTMIAAPIALFQLGSLFHPAESGYVFWVSFLVFTIGIAAYFGFTFLAFLAASLAYGRIPLKFDAQYVIILGSGLIGDKVPRS